MGIKGAIAFGLALFLFYVVSNSSAEIGQDLGELVAAFRAAIR